MSKMKFVKFFGIFVLCLAFTAVYHNSYAATDTEELQPAAPAEAVKVGDVGRYLDEYNSYMELNTSLHSSETAHFPDIHIGEQLVGGVTYFNGTIANITTDPASGTDMPITVGDDLRVDGRIWRGINRHPDDGLPVIVDDDMILKGGIWGGDNKGTASGDAALKIYDTMIPGLDDTNNLGSSSRRWQELYVSDNILGGNIIHEDNLSVTNSATANYYLGYAGNNRFVWNDVADHDTLSGLSCSSGQITVYNGSSWICADVTDYDTLGLLSCDDGDIVVYDDSTSAWVCSAVGEAISDAIDRSETIISTDVRIHDHDTDGSSETITSHFEQGRIQVTAAEVTTCSDRDTGYTNLGNVTFSEAYTSQMVITATYDATEAAPDVPSGGDENVAILPINIVRTTGAGSTVTGFTAYGCPEEHGYINWFASGEDS